MKKVYRIVFVDNPLGIPHYEVECSFKFPFGIRCWIVWKYRDSKYVWKPVRFDTDKDAEHSINYIIAEKLETTRKVVKTI